jgi:hypothetical protein
VDCRVEGNVREVVVATIASVLVDGASPRQGIGVNRADPPTSFENADSEVAGGTLTPNFGELEVISREVDSLFALVIEGLPHVGWDAHAGPVAAVTTDQVLRHVGWRSLRGGSLPSLWGKGMGEGNVPEVPETPRQWAFSCRVVTLQPGAPILSIS